jgi:hypothetical protein
MTPITAGYGFDSSADSTESPVGPAAVFGSLAGLEMVAIMRSLCAVRVSESRRERVLRTQAGAAFSERFRAKWASGSRNENASEQNSRARF